MKSKLFTVLIVVTIFCLVLNSPVLAESSKEVKPEKPGKKPVTPAVDEAKLAKLSVTNHSIVIDKKPLNYKATAGYMLMKDDSGKLQATIFFIAYSKEGKNDLQKRPITFAFNGGPGAAACWIHMGGLGPKRVRLSEEGFVLPQPYEYVDNEYTWLTFTDLVFIDPVSTGYSRPAPGVEKKKFHGLEEDIKSVGDFIRLYVTKNNRWLSPKFICGESYGTTRAAGLSSYLQDTYGMYLQGLVLVSTVLHYQNSRFFPGNDMPCVLFLPTYTATAWYHKKLPAKYQEDLESTLKEVEQWALTDYLVALAKGDKLTEQERNTVIDKLAQYTGLSRKYIDNTNLRIEIFRFIRELLRDEKQVVGRLDSRFKHESLDAAGEFFEEDPSFVIAGPFVAVINHYIRSELKYVNDIPYWPLTFQVHPWNWGRGNRYVNAAERLRKAIENNKYLKVMIANGYYDLATPYFAALYTVNHIGLPESLAKNIVMKYYEAGHMMYIHNPSIKKLRDDAREFYRNTIK
ncbi:MAG: peptidase S10 [Candidatus Aminicenantes bacterium]|nr:peptidase S10 [Candidatus Aminicenantes bacterium]NIM82837.1 peptidase S10 [Candidatus Aminicenantes bacterium]NIN22213.1 peptidase S10 [Candidatus Aminicenantes bacterium]NIN45981.1 peptidase S10 [Candidatus Aminicenantes bacterium]NIN88817.1 peptidase S10 [Candidatus Aminicenantes bacterium]